MFAAMKLQDIPFRDFGVRVIPFGDETEHAFIALHDDSINLRSIDKS